MDTKTRQDTMIALVLAGNPLKDACEEVNISVQAWYEWLKNDEDFKDRLEEARRRSFLFSCDRLIGLKSVAIEKSKEILESPDSPTAVKVSLIRVIFEASSKAIDYIDINNRLSTLETYLGAQDEQ